MMFYRVILQDNNNNSVYCCCCISPPVCTHVSKVCMGVNCSDPGYDSGQAPTACCPLDYTTPDPEQVPAIY